ncbi:MAG: PD40 domain-containing protein, partial [Phycisphaerales bacterium]|nr:PD40 domain-containing protein [Phycisphaerales bacterium]
MRDFVTAAALVAASGLAAADVDPHGGMLRYPDVSKDRIVFSYANDLWTVSRDGGDAVPLASPSGAEAFPRFSPDGQTIAFVGNYDGGTDVYTIPVGGGLAHRVTHHPASEQICDWTDDGRILYFSNAFSGLGRQAKLQLVDAEGGLPEVLPVPYGARGAIQGDWLAYTPWERDFRTWKRYR